MTFLVIGCVGIFSPTRPAGPRQSAAGVSIILLSGEVHIAGGVALGVQVAVLHEGYGLSAEPVGDVLLTGFGHARGVFDR